MSFTAAANRFRHLFLYPWGWLQALPQEWLEGVSNYWPARQVLSGLLQQGLAGLSCCRGCRLGSASRSWRQRSCRCSRRHHHRHCHLPKNKKNITHKAVFIWAALSRDFAIEVVSLDCFTLVTKERQMTLLIWKCSQLLKNWHSFTDLYDFRI